jgi:hypothetical protein
MQIKKINHTISKYRILLAFLVCVVAFTVVYFKMTTDNNQWFSTTIKEYGLELDAREYDNKSGRYLKISGKYNGNDTLFEYVLYSQPFGLGPNKAQAPVKKITTGRGSTKTEDYYICLQPNDSLFGKSQSFPMTQNDQLIFRVFDSLVKRSDSRLEDYRKHFQDITRYTGQLMSETDEGLFLQTLK